MKKLLVGLLAVCFIGGIVAPAFSITQAEQIKAIQKYRQEQAEKAKKAADALKKYGVPKGTATTTTTTTTITTLTTTTTIPPVIITDKFKDPNLLLLVKKAIAQKTGKTVDQIVDITEADAKLITKLSSTSQISDLSGMEYLVNLDDLWMSNNPKLETLSPLVNCTKMKVLEAHDCAFKDLSGLQNMSALTTLKVFSNAQLKDITALAGLKNLKTIFLYDTAVKDISPLIENANSGDEVWLPGSKQMADADKISWAQVEQLINKGVNVTPSEKEAYYDPFGTPTSTTTTTTLVPASFQFPVSISIDSNNNIYILDNIWVKKCKNDNGKLMLVKDITNAAVKVKGMAIDKDDSILIIDKLSGCIKKYNSEAVFIEDYLPKDKMPAVIDTESSLKITADKISGGFCFADKTGKVYIYDQNKELKNTKSFIALIQDMQYDDAGSLYVAYPYQYVGKLVSPLSDVVAVDWGAKGYVYGLGIDKNGYIYCVFDNKVIKFDKAGNQQAVYGEGTITGGADIAIDSSGTMYIVGKKDGKQDVIILNP